MNGYVVDQIIRLGIVAHNETDFGKGNEKNTI